MDDDLRQRLVQELQRAPEGRPDVASAIRDGRRSRLLRTVGSVAATAFVLVAVGVGLRVVTAHDPKPAPEQDVTHHNDGIFVPAEKGDATYILSEFEIRYPWAPVDGTGERSRKRPSICRIRSEWYCGHRRRQAALLYEWRWATNKYPGTVDCRGTLFDQAGHVVGRAAWELAGLETRSRQPAVMPFRVSGRPTRGDAECEAGSYVRGSGIRVTYIGSEPYAPSYSGEETSPPDRIRLLFRAEATTQDEEHLDSRMCFLTVNFESGKVEHGKFTTNQGPGTWRIGIYPADDPVEHAQIRCRSIRASDS